MSEREGETIEVYLPRVVLRRRFVRISLADPRDRPRKQFYLNGGTYPFGGFRAALKAGRLEVSVSRISRESWERRKQPRDWRARPPSGPPPA